MPAATLAQWLQRLEHLHPEEIELGLDRVSIVAERLGVIEQPCSVVTVAGTNGKGSTVACLDAILRGADWQVGAYTSPHLLRFNERICIDGISVSDEVIVASFERIEAVRNQVPLTYFEYATLSALVIFGGLELDAIILEVGLGGRLDAVNIVDPDIAVITAIDLDHQSWLGDDREQIALEKAGILREQRPFVCADLKPAASLRKRATELACVSHYIAAAKAQVLGENLPLRGENMAAAQCAASILGVNIEDQALRGLVNGLELPGRLQRIDLAELHCLIDVAHNPAAVKNLANFLRQNGCAGRTIAVFAALSDKNIRAMIRSIQAQVDDWFIADLPNVPRAGAATELSEILRSEGVTRVSSSDNPRRAYRRACSVAGAGDRLVVFGSFYTIAAVLPCIEKDRRRLE